MLHTLLTWLKQIHFGILIIIPILLFLVIIHILTGKRWKSTLTISGIVAIAATGTAAFYAWELYLSNHFIGSYDSQGIPYQFSGPGWDFFITTWPVWAIPSIVFILLALFTQAYFRRHKKETIDWSKTLPGKEADRYIQQQLEIQRLKQSLEVANETLSSLGKAPIIVETRPLEDEMSYEEYSTLRKLEDDIAGLKAVCQALSTQNENLKTDLANKDRELSRVKNMLRTFMTRLHQ